MKRLDDYRRNARECLELAARMPDPQRQQLLRMAGMWEELAEEREAMLRVQGVVEFPGRKGAG